jgi:hypothetical protein
MKKILFLFLILSIQSASTKSIKQAIKDSDSTYFEKLTKQELDLALQENADGLIGKSEITSLPALVGVFKNSDPEVRKKIYEILLYPEMFKDLKDISASELLSADKELKTYLDKIRTAMYEINEPSDSVAIEVYYHLIDQYGFSLKEAIRAKNAKAISLMSSDFFESSNKKDPKGIINRFKQHSVKTLVSALGFSNITEGTKSQIIEALAFKDLGGPEKIVSKKKIRRKRAESLFLLADVEKNEKLKPALIDLAEKYYYPEEDENVTNEIKVDSEQEMRKKK